MINFIKACLSILIFMAFGSAFTSYVTLKSPIGPEATLNKLKQSGTDENFGKDGSKALPSYSKEVFNLLKQAESTDEEFARLYKENEGIYGNNVRCRQGTLVVEKLTSDPPPTQSDLRDISSMIINAQKDCGKAAAIYPTKGNKLLAAVLANKASEVSSQGHDSRLKAKADPRNKPVDNRPIYY